MREWLYFACLVLRVVVGVVLIMCCEVCVFVSAAAGELVLVCVCELVSVVTSFLCF